MRMFDSYISELQKERSAATQAGRTSEGVARRNQPHDDSGGEGLVGWGKLGEQAAQIFSSTFLL